MSDPDLQIAAQRMFPGMTPADAAPTATPAADPEAPRQPRSDEERAAILYRDSPVHADAERAIENSMMERGLATPEEAKAAAAEWLPIFREFDLNSTEASTVAGLGLGVHHNPPSDETLAAWTADAKSGLVQDFGVKGAGQALADAKQLVAKNPTLQRYLAETGLGSHPHIVRLVAQKARALRVQGKL